MAFPDQAGLVVRLKEIEVGKPFIAYHEVVAVIYGRFQPKSLNIYVRMPPNEQYKGTLGGMIDGTPCPFDENTEVIRCSS